MVKTLILKALLLICSLVIAGCNSGEWNGKDSKDKSKKQSKAKPVLVELAEVSVGPIEKILERSAPLEAEAQVQVNARTSNPAVDLLVEEGDKVKKGQVLLRLENDRQKNDFDAAKSLLDKEQIDFARQENLYKDNLISEQEYRNAKFSLSQRQLSFEEAQRQFEYTEVRAPID
ncbi:MAG: biotin/lipoyl-binding protein, partial [Verrucomicrobiota bacterium]|nr:biotin/lipoyl-binding protein [Verrucomicrobiota bacterium]